MAPASSGRLFSAISAVGEYKGMRVSGKIEEVFEEILLFMDEESVLSPTVSFTATDEEGGKCLVHVLHVAREGVEGILPADTLRQFYPAGSRIIIKDPLVPSVGQILVENPAKLVVNCFDPLLSAAEVRALGDGEFRRHRYFLAIKYYQQFDFNDVLDTSSMLSLYKKVHCLCSIKDFERAYLTCCLGIKLEPTNETFLHKLGEIHYSLGEFELAVQVLEPLCPTDNIDNLKNLLRPLVLQASTGDYSCVLQNWFLGKYSQAPEFADFVGPVGNTLSLSHTHTVTMLEIKLVPGKEKRSLFARRDVPAGALLLVSNAVSFQKSETGLPIIPAVVSEVFLGCLQSPDFLQQVLSLPEPSLTRAKAIPPLHWFGSNRMGRGGKVISEEKFNNYSPDEVEFKRIKRIVENCSFTKCRGNRPLYTALWLLPAFLYHSCLPNVSKVVIGKTAFFHANRDIKAGEELTVKRFEKKWNDAWSCDCKLCAAQTKFARKLLPLRRAYDNYIEGREQVKLAGLAPVIEAALSGASAEERSLLRTSFPAAFVEYHLLTSSSTETEISTVMEAVAQDLAPWSFRINELSKKLGGFIGYHKRAGPTVAPPEMVIQDLRNWAPGSIEFLKKLGVQNTPDDFKTLIGLQAVSREVMDAMTAAF